ncbi:MAG: hypothetical protein O7B25_01175, partial [Gammaproteobacteria bacterium]|nr:hypothetical protein [Gammaproteobacteria bacterium]
HSYIHAAWGSIWPRSGSSPNGSNGPDELFALALNVTLVPMLLYAGSVFVIWRYPLSGQRLTRLRDAYVRRHARREASEP